MPHFKFFLPASLAVLAFLPVALPAQLQPQRAPNVLGSGPDNLYLAAIPGAPFSATIDGRQKVAAADPRRSGWKQEFLARDKDGRIVKELRAFDGDGHQNHGTLMTLEYIDPTEHLFYRCIPQNHTCFLYPFAATSTPHWGLDEGIPATSSASAAKSAPTVLGHKKFKGFQVTGYEAKVPLNLSIARPSNSTTSIPAINAGPRDLGAINLKREVPDQNNSIFSTAPSSSLASHLREPMAVSEFWYAPDLQADLALQYQTEELTHIFSVAALHTGDPDPRFFEPPANYRILEAKMQ